MLTLPAQEICHVRFNAISHSVTVNNGFRFEFGWVGTTRFLMQGEFFRGHTGLAAGKSSFCSCYLLLLFLFASLFSQLTSDRFPLVQTGLCILLSALFYFMVPRSSSSILTPNPLTSHKSYFIFPPTHAPLVFPLFFFSI